MSRLSILLSAGTVLTASLLLSGCTPPADSGPSSGSPSTITAPSGGELPAAPEQGEEPAGDTQ